MRRPQVGGGAVLAAVSLALSVPATTAGAAPATRCTSSRAQLCVNAADGGRTARARVGQRVELVLATAGQRWGEPRLIGHALVAVGAPRRSGIGWTAAYRAVRPGTAAVQATEQPSCAKGVACPQYVLLWRVQVLVSR